MREIFKKIIIFCLYWSGANWLYLQLFAKKNLILLRYHSVNSNLNKTELHAELYPDLTISDADFEKQLLWLKKNNFSFLTFEKLYFLLSERKPLPPRSIIVYFDDGFRDNFLNAYPILKKMGIPTTIFLTTDFVDQKEVPWSFKIRDIIFNTTKDTVHFGMDEFRLNGQEGRELAAKKIIRKGKLQMSQSDVQNEIEKIKTEAGIAVNPGELGIFLSWREVSSMSDVFEFGSHAVSHKKMADLKIPEMLSELRDSKRLIEEKIGKSVIALSYPHGSYNAGTEKIALSLGYKLLVTASNGINKIINTKHLFSIKAETSGDFRLFKLKLGILYPVAFLFKKR